MITHVRKSALSANFYSVTCLSQQDHTLTAALPHSRDPFDGAALPLCWLTRAPITRRNLRVLICDFRCCLGAHRPFQLRKAVGLANSGSELPR